ncbi:hypothetical protein PY093_09865 [Cytobacillus sp. S13-E01]|nr:hypothetical protein [Cytobacillus sp. S13-E01]MDF0727023.1 hypothetical protein [Cytobacillus sp. S13-E01]
MAKTTEAKKKSNIKKPPVDEKHKAKSEQWQRFYQLVEEKLKK